MNWKIDKKYVIVADFEYHRVLLRIKEQHPELDFKVMRKEDILDLLSFSYVKDPIPMLLKEGKYDYSKLKRLLKVLRVVNPENEETEPYLFALKQRLEKEGCLQYDSLGKYQLKNKEILIFEGNEDYELQNVLKRNSLDFGFLSFEEIGLSKTYEKQPNLLLFPDKFTQYFHIFADMRKRIVEDKEDQAKFSLFIDGDDDYYISFFSSLFHLPAKLWARKPLISDNQVKLALNGFFKNKNFEYTDKADDNTPLWMLLELVNKYQLKELASIQGFDFAYSNLMEVLTGNEMTDFVSDRGVRVTDKLSFDDYNYYITNFVFDTFYKVFDDTNVFDDEKLKRLGCNTSYDQTNLDKRKKFNFITYNNVISASRVKLHLGDKIYDSQFLKEQNWKMTKADFDLDGLYTTEAVQLLKSKFKDDSNARQDESYKTYDNVYEHVDYPHSYTDKNGNVKNRVYSASALKTYYNCPFRYYCDSVLGLDKNLPVEKYFDMSMGVLIHKVFENIYHSSFDFDKAFEEGVQAYKKDLQNKNLTFTAKDEAWIEIEKPWIKHIAAAVTGQKSSSNIVDEKAESNISFVIHSDKTGRDYPMTGSVDKIAYTQGSNGEKFYTVIDYKTGSEDFDITHVFLGGSLQLPLYCYGLEHQVDTGKGQPTDYVNGYSFSGFGIQHIYLKKFSQVVKKNPTAVSTDIIKKNLRIGGVYSLDEDYLHSFDNTMFGPKGFSAKKAQYLKGYGYQDKDSVLFKGYTLRQMEEDALLAAAHNLDSMYDGKFEIAPVIEKKNGDPDCGFCPFRNVCYRKLSDGRDITSLIDRKFNENDEEENEEEE